MIHRHTRETWLCVWVATGLAVLSIQAESKGATRRSGRKRAARYRIFEGVRRDENYIKQAQGFVQKGNKWITWDEMLKRLPVKVAILKGSKEYVGELVANTKDSISIRVYVNERDPRRVRVKAPRVAIRPLRRREEEEPGPDEMPGEEGVEEEERPVIARRGTVLRVIRKAPRGAGYVVQAPGRESKINGFVPMSAVEPVTVPRAKLLRWNKAMFKPVITDLSKPYRDAVTKMKSSDVTTLRRAARFWSLEADPHAWPNARWMAARCLDLAKLYEKGKGRLRGKLEELPRGPKTVEPNVAGPIEPMPGPVVTIKKKGADIRLLKGKTRGKPGQQCEFIRFGKLRKEKGVTKGWILVKGVFNGKEQKAWVYTTQVALVLVVHAPSADVLIGKKKVGILRQGDRVRFLGISTSGKYFKVTKEGGGHRLTGYVAKTAFFPQEPG